MKKFAGIIFDFNGVLLWDTPWHEAVWQVMSKELRGTKISPDEMRTKVLGRTNGEIFSGLLGRQVTGLELAQLARRKEQTYRDYALAHRGELKLSPGSETFLNYLLAHGIRRTIATNSEIENVRFYFDHLQLDTWFDFKKVVYNDGDLPGKPDPTIYLLASKLIGLQPEDCMAIDDSPVGVAAARAAHVGKVIAIGPREMHEVLEHSSQVDQIIEGLDEIELSQFEIAATL